MRKILGALALVAVLGGWSASQVTGTEPSRPSPCKVKLRYTGVKPCGVKVCNVGGGAAIFDGIVIPGHEIDVVGDLGSQLELWTNGRRCGRLPCAAPPGQGCGPFVVCEQPKPRHSCRAVASPHKYGGSGSLMLLPTRGLIIPHRVQ